MNAKRSKSRAGCRTCKIKRLKCDEAIPSCRNCVVRGIVCPGYRKDLKWSTKYETRRPSTTAGPLQFEELASAASKSIHSKADGAPPNRQNLGHQGAADVAPSRAAVPDSSLKGNDNDFCPGELSPGVKPVNFGTGLPGTRTDNVSVEECLAECLAPTAVNTDGQDNADRSTETFNVIEEHLSTNSPSQLSDADTALCLPSPCQTLALPSTQLVDLWFKSVCGVWSAFDSPCNPFRRLCSSLWTTSEVVFYSLQSMAGTSQPSLTINSPGIKETATMAPRRANQALIRELRTLFESPKSVSVVPSALLVSLFCMSSSCSWVDSRELGLQYLGNARLVLDLLELNSQSLNQEDRDLFAFFKGCLIYEQMLRGIVSDREEDLSVLLEWNTEDPTTNPLTLHSWTGVSTPIVMLLGKSMALCRKSRDLWRHRPVATYDLMFQTLLDIEAGQRLEESLLSIDVSGQLDGLNKMVTENSIQIDLYNATEAFRLSALLQLYQTFPDLLSRRLPNQDATDDPMFRRQWVTGLAIRISRILEEISATSPMRCLQPLLCICAGSGLRHESPLVLEEPQNDNLLIISREDSVLSESTEVSPKRTVSEDVALEVSQARAFLLSRLSELDQNILSNPVTVAKQLLAAMWSAFDKDKSPHKIHWMDIMASTKAWTVFG